MSENNVEVQTDFRARFLSNPWSHAPTSTATFGLYIIYHRDGCPPSNLDIRRSSYKIGIDRDEVRRQREEHLVDIRKQKLEDHLMKKRHDKMGTSMLLGGEN